MKLIVHRGAHEIGGSCLELLTENSRILIDFGIPLVNEKKEPFDSKILALKSIGQLKQLKILPDVRGLYRNEEKAVDAILISHSHLDHYGFLKFANPEIPVYMSEEARQLIEISDIFIPHKTGHIKTRILDKGKKTKIGDFIVTAYLVDHSAFDALAFTIEAEGKKLFYSGDFRGHGRKSSLFKRMLDNPPKDTDCLVMEGTMLGRNNQEYKDEIVVEDAIADILKAKSNIAFLFASSQNIDRLVSAYRACLKTDTTFVIDLYTAFILYKLADVSKHIPQFNWRNIRVKYFKYHADKIVKSGHKDLLYKFNKRKIEMPEIDSSKNRVLMLLRDNSLFPVVLKHIRHIRGATIIYSMWEGYLTDKFLDYCTQNRINIKQIHTSGHATAEDLKRFANALKPKTIIPIHTFEAQKYPALFKNVKILKDDEEFSF